MASFRVLSLVCLFLAIQAISGWQNSHTQSKRNYEKDQINKGPVKNNWNDSKKKEPKTAPIKAETPKFEYKPGTKVFEPIEIDFPDTVRTGAAADEYKQKLLAPLPARAKQDDPNMVMTGESCARGLGSLYKVFNKGKELLYSVCFDDDTASAIFSTHSIDLAGKEQKRSKHLNFKPKYTLYGWSIDKLYTAKYQEDAFNKEFGKDAHLADHEIKKCNYFSRNHLTPHADFATVENQELTYYFQNCFPGKQSMNAQNWSKVEFFVRKISIQLEKALQIFTGVYGTLKKNNTAGQLTEVYLDTENHRVKAPLVVWKLVVDKKTNDSVAFFTSNDIDMDDDEQKTFATICDSVCDELAYDFNPSPKAGFTVCCKYEDFAKHIKFIPFELKETNLLTNPVHIAKKNDPKSKSWSRSNSSPESDEGTPEV